MFKTNKLTFFVLGLSLFLIGCATQSTEPLVKQQPIAKKQPVVSDTVVNEPLPTIEQPATTALVEPKQNNIEFEIDKALLTRPKQFIDPVAKQPKPLAIIDLELKAHKFNSAEATYRLGAIYNKGYRTIAVDNSKAFKLLSKAAKQDHAKAQNAVGFMYQKGLGVKQSYSKAVYWYVKAIKNGSTKALFNIGWLYQYGKGLKQSYNKAFFYYHRAARKGDAIAMHKVAVMYEQGLGTKKDMIKANDWFDKYLNKSGIK